MTFLEERRKAEDEDREGKPKPKWKLKTAAATISSTPYDAFAKQLKRQQQKFETLMGKVQSMITTLQTHTVQATFTFRQGNPSFGIRGRGRTPFNNNGERGGPGGWGLPAQSRWRGAAPTTETPLPAQYYTSPGGAGECQNLMLTTNVGSVGKWGISRGIAPCQKARGCFREGEHEQPDRFTESFPMYIQIHKCRW